MSNEKVKKTVDKIGEKVAAAKGERTTSSNSFFEEAYNSESDALKAFDNRKGKFLSSKGWSELSGPENASFELFDEIGKVSSEDIFQVGFFLKIDLPGPVPQYWVRLEKIEITSHKVIVHLTPSYDPTAYPVNKTITVHFFRNITKNTLALERKGNILIGSQKGINEIANNEQPEAGNNATINTTVATAGVAGVSQYQWARFTKNLVTV